MSPTGRISIAMVGTAALFAAFAITANGQASKDAPFPKPTALPNPYRLAADWPTLPAGMKGPNGHKWGEVIRVHVAPDGHIWVFQRCFNDKPNGDATCLGRGDANPPILEFSPAGRLLKSFGVGLFAHPHGFTLDSEGNIWTTDTNDSETILGMPAKNARGVTLGQEVLKISPTGKVLMTIGTEGVGGNGPYLFDRPTGVAIGANGDIFVADGHSRNRSNSARVVKYSRDGKFIKAWGQMGSEPGNFREPHDIYVGGSRGYVYVADRLNDRIQVFDQNGTFIAAWKQFGQPSSVFVDKHDMIFVGTIYQSAEARARNESPMAPTASGNDRAIVIGNAITGELKYLIPDPGDLSKMTDTGTSASGIAEDDQGNIYAADVGENNLRKYVLNAPSTFAQGTRMTVLSSNGFRAVIQELAPQFEKATGNQVVISFSVAAELKKRIDRGEPFDLAILTPSLMDDLIKQGTVVRESRVALARTGMAIAVRRGAAKPDLRSVDALKASLIASPSIAFAKEGAGGLFFTALVERLGLTATLTPKFKTFTTGDDVREAVGRGDAALGVMPVSEILPAPGLEVAGLFPSAVQDYAVMVAGISRRAAGSAGVRAFIEFLKSTGSTTVVEKNGMERVP